MSSSFSLGFEVGAKSKFTRSVSDPFGSLRFSSVLSPSFVIGGGIGFPHHVRDSEGASRIESGESHEASAEGSIVGQPSRRVVARDNTRTIEARASFRDRCVHWG